MLKGLKGLLSIITFSSMIAVSFILPTLANDNYAVILIYHKFDEQKSPSTSIPIKTFEMQMKYLKENNYNVVSIEKLIKYLDRKSIPPKTVVITIDDGYKSTMKAFKILKKYNFPFTVFLYMEGIGSYPDYLTLDQIKKLKEYPYITFGNHSYSHKHFAKVKAGFNKEKYIKNFKNDILKSEKKFKKLIGYKPLYYAYPYGDYNELLTEILKKAGYKAGFTQDPSSVSMNIDKFIIPRQPIVGHWGNLNHFKKILNIRPLSVESYYPRYGILKENPLKKIEAKIKNLKNYKNCGIYVSEIGWLEGRIKDSKVFVENLPKLKRWKNRIGITCFDKKYKKSSRFFYMVINPFYE